MLELIPSRVVNNHFSFLDVGCGNGWVVRKVQKIQKCIKSVGIDGAEKMIKKAIQNDSQSKYLKLDIETMDYTEKFDVVFSMEVFYYFKDPFKVLEYIYQNILKQKGCLILGVDHYLENKSSLNWSQSLNLDLKTFSMDDWCLKIKDLGFSKVEKYQFGAKEDWGGTLVIYAEK